MLWHIGNAKYSLIDLETVVRAAGKRTQVNLFHPEFSPPWAGWVSLQTQPVLSFLLSGSHVPGNAMARQSCPGGIFSRTYSINYFTSLVLQGFESTMISALTYYPSSSQSLLYPVDILRNPPSPNRLIWSQQVRPGPLLIILLVAYTSLYDLPWKKKMTLKFWVASRGQGARTQCLRRLGSNWNLISMHTNGPVSSKTSAETAT